MAVLILALAAVVFVLPRVVDAPDDEAVLEPLEGVEEPIPIATPQTHEETTPEPINNGLRRTVDEALAEGRNALIARDPAAAAAAFRRAAVLEPDNPTAAEGLRKSSILARVQELEVAAVTHENRGENQAAAVAARRALELDPKSKTALGVAARVARQAYRAAYHDLVTRGLAALESGDYNQALDDFTAAAKLSPKAREVTDGLDRAEAGILREKVDAHIGRAAEAEAAENWPAAVNEYRFALDLEPGRADASDGLKRSSRRLELSRKMNYHLGNPERLATIEVLEDTAALVAEARDVSPKGPRFSDLVERLDGLVVQWSSPVPVVLESDGLTEIVLFRVGQLGTFNRHTTELRPGTYTVIGRRTGFRDVRLNFKVAPGKPSAPVIIRCTEAI